MKYLSNYMEDAQTIAFDNFGAFFAFGQSQFDQKKKEGVIYVNMGSGLICPKENAAALNESLKNIYTDAVKQDVAENGADAIIEREYFNYESQISCSTENAVSALSGHVSQFPELFTPEKIKAVFSACWNKAVENDWF